ncbi:MAG: radical SAM protein, partial [Puniceicoccales bacterium]|nr:radical SAM protein [Puniceicoccales bacterium]
MRVYVHTHGCRLNAAESRHWIEELESQGLTVTEKMDETVNVAIVNSCAVTDEAESKCRQSIRQIIRIQPEVGLIITGCMVERNPQALLRAHHRLLILGNGEKHRLVTHIRDLARGKIIAPIIRPILAKEDFTLPCVLEKDYPKRYNLKIQEGCDFGCSYCIIPRLRGKGRSRDFGNLLEDARIHVQKGVKEIVLTGINVGLYGNDSKHLSDVITALNDLPGLERI